MYNAPTSIKVVTHIIFHHNIMFIICNITYTNRVICAKITVSHLDIFMEEGFGKCSE